jgi:DNA-binding transcriptional ArsR family regulator
MDHDPLDPVWKALANPFRRKILDLLREEAMTTGDLASAFPELSRYAVMQHLDVLARANLIVARKEGRQRFNHLNAVPIRQIYERWVSRYEGHWASALIALKREIEGETSEKPAGPAKPAARPQGTRSAPGAGPSGRGASRGRSSRRHGGE